MVIAAVIPSDAQCVGRAFRPPPRIGHDRNRIRHAHHAANTRHAGDRRFVDRLQRAAEDGTLHDGGVKHVRQPHVDRIDRLRRDLVENVESLARRAGKLPGARRFQLDVGRWLDLSRRFGDVAERQRPSARVMHDRAVARAALRRRHAPARRRRGDQHFARRRAGAAQIALRRRDRAAGPGRGIAPNLIEAQIFRWRYEFGLDRRPIAFELLGHQHRETGQGALPHFGAGDADRHRVVGRNDHPAGDVGRARQYARRRAGPWPQERNGKAERQAAAGGARTDEEGTAIEFAADAMKSP